MIHADDMIRVGEELQQNVDVQQPLLAINWDTLGRSELDLPATFAGASRYQPTGGGDVEATTAASADMPMQDATLHTGRSPAALELGLPQMQSRDACQPPGQDMRVHDEDNSIPMDLDSDTESAGPAGKLPKHGARKRSKAARAQHARRQQRQYWEGALPAHAGLAPTLAVNPVSLGMLEVPCALPAAATVAGQTISAHTLDVSETLVQSSQRQPTYPGR